MIQLLGIKILELEKTKYFKFNYRRPYIPAVEKTVYFLLTSILFISLFSIIEKLNILDTLYYYLTSVSTIGYGDISPKTDLGKILFILFIPCYAVIKLAVIVNTLIEARKYTYELKKAGRLFMPYSNHIVLFFNAESVQSNRFIWLQRFIEEHQKHHILEESQIVLVNISVNFNQQISDFVEKTYTFDGNIKLVNSDIYEKGIFDKLSLSKAKLIYVLSDDVDNLRSDSIVVDTVNRLIDSGYNGQLLVEMIDDNMGKMLKNTKKVQSVLRPNRSHPEMLVRCAVAPGSEYMFEELASVGGDAVERFNVRKDKVTWADLVYQVSKHDLGTVTGYFNQHGELDNNPNGSSVVDVYGLLIVVHELGERGHQTVNLKLQSILDNL